MPANIRQWALRELDRASGNLDWTGTHLIAVISTYQEAHPEIAEPLIAIVELLKTAQDAVIKVRSII